MVIYGLYEPGEIEPRYIGVTRTSLQIRLSGHLCDGRRGGASHRVRWIGAMLKKGTRPEIRAIETVGPEASWQERECFHIAEARSRGLRLVNSTDGGDGVAGRDWRPNAEQRRRMSDAQRGKKASEETKAVRSAALKQRYLADPIQMAGRQEMARRAGRTPRSREAASNRMRQIWSDPVRAEQMRERMRGAKARKAETK